VFNVPSVEFDSILPEFDSVCAEQGAVGIAPSSDEATPPVCLGCAHLLGADMLPKKQKNSFPPEKSEMSRFCHAKNLEGTDFWG
jgi:hypothetical protein